MRHLIAASASVAAVLALGSVAVSPVGATSTKRTCVRVAGFLEVKAGRGKQYVDFTRDYAQDQKTGAGIGVSATAKIKPQYRHVMRLYFAELQLDANDDTPIRHVPMHISKDSSSASKTMPINNVGVAILVKMRRVGCHASAGAGR